MRCADLAGLQSQHVYICRNDTPVSIWRCGRWSQRQSVLAAGSPHALFVLSGFLRYWTLVYARAHGPAFKGTLAGLEWTHGEEITTRTPGRCLLGWSAQPRSIG